MALRKKARSVKKKKTAKRKSGRPALVTPAQNTSTSSKKKTSRKKTAQKKKATAKAQAKKKAVVKKTSQNAVATKKTASGSANASKTLGKKTLGKKTLGKKTLGKKAVAKKAAAKKAPQKRAVAKKTTDRKKGSEAVAGKKTTAKKAIGSKVSVSRQVKKKHRKKKSAVSKPATDHNAPATSEPVSSNRRNQNKQRPPRKYAFEIASREQLIDELVNADTPLNQEQLAGVLQMHERDEKYEALGRRLGAMVRDGQIVRNRRGGFLPVDEANLIRGRVSAHPDGFGFLINEAGGEDIFLAARQMRSVMDGDRVVVQVISADRKGRLEGAVLEVIERAVKTFVGRLQLSRGVAVIQPDNKRLSREIMINDTASAKDGQIVLAEIVEPPTNSRPAIASVVEVLGEHLSPGMEIDIAIRARDIPSEWPDEVVFESSAIGSTVSSAAIKERRDIRSTPLVTIDGEDARDFDDAVYAEEKANGFRLVVAIADVSHYVTPDSPLDKEAFNRGTSVYFPQRVVPMLPESLSNGLCSLNPDVDRLCMVCDMTIDLEGQIKRAKFYPATMRSHARLTYTQVHHYLTSSTTGGQSKQQKAAIEKIGALGQHIDVLHKLYGVMRNARSERGAIEFESNETRIIFNDQKKIDEIQPVERNDAHMLIEECMIAANISAARYIGKRKIPGLYRSHEGPGADKLLELRKFLSLRGLQLEGGDHPGAIDYAHTLASAEGRPDKLVIQTVMLRSMNQAVYSTRNAGHFGLALEEYAHFTSPIRRYPDLMVHRAIKHMIVHNDKSNFEYSPNHMAEIGDHCSTTERRAEEATRDVIAWLKCEFMQDHIGGTYDGVVTGVTSFGLFVELSGIHVEGLVHITSLPQDYYDFDSANHQLLGRKGGLSYSLGQVISVVVAAVNLDERKIDFQIDKSRIGSAAHGGRKPKGRKPKGRKQGGRNRHGSNNHDQNHASSSGKKKPRKKPKKPKKKKSGSRRQNG